MIDEKKSQALTEKEIDEIVCAEANDNHAWSRAEAVNPSLAGCKNLKRIQASNTKKSGKR